MEGDRVRYCATPHPKNQHRSGDLGLEIRTQDPPPGDEALIYHVRQPQDPET